MTGHLEKALLTIAADLNRLDLPYMVIGGLANALWGEPRATLDVDVTVWVEDDKIPAAIAALGHHYTILVPQPEHFIRETRVLPLQTPEGIRIDLVFGMLPFEKSAIERAVSKEVSGSVVRFCTAEDLILHKIISDRPKDLNDSCQIIRRQKDALDHAYLQPLIKELSQALNKPEIWDNWRKWSSQ